MTTAEKKGRAEGRAEGLAEGLAEGRAQGRAEGFAEGRDERSVEIARNLKSMNLPTADIAKATGLTAEEIDKL